MENPKKNTAPEDWLQAGAKQFGKREIEAAKQGDIAPLLGKLSPDERRRVEAMLGDGEALRKLAQDPQVQKLMRRLNGNG